MEICNDPDVGSKIKTTSASGQNEGKSLKTPLTDEFKDQNAREGTVNCASEAFCSLGGLGLDSKRARRRYRSRCQAKRSYQGDEQRVMTSLRQSSGFASPADSFTSTELQAPYANVNAKSCLRHAGRDDSAGQKYSEVASVMAEGGRRLHN